jgi:hypothetical protein
MEQELPSSRKYVATSTKHPCGSVTTSLTVKLSDEDLIEMTDKAILLPREPYSRTLQDYCSSIEHSIQVAFCFDNKLIIVYADPIEPVSYAYLRAVNSYLGTSRTYKWLLSAPSGINVKAFVSEVNEPLNVRCLKDIRDVLEFWNDLLLSSTFPYGQDLKEYFIVLSYLTTVTYPSYRDMSRLVKSIAVDITYSDTRTLWDWDNLHKSLSVPYYEGELEINCAKVLYGIFRYPIYYFFLFKYLDGNPNCQVNDTICMMTKRTYKGLRKCLKVTSNLQFEGQPFLKQYVLLQIDKVLRLIDANTYNGHSNKDRYLLNACNYLEE